MKKDYGLKHLFFLALAIITTGLFLISVFTKQKLSTPTSSEELFDSKLITLSSINELSNYVDSVYLKEYMGLFDTMNYVSITSDLVKKRFTYGLSNYSFNDNWVINLLGRVCWSHITAKVKPDDILSAYDGLCSQQTIVFMEVLKRKGLQVRTVGLGFPQGPGHFLCEVSYDGQWHLYDVTKEPVWDRAVNKHESMDYYLANKDSLYLVYENRIEKSELTKIITNVHYGKINEFPAKRMLLLHKLCNVALFGLPILFWYVYYRARKNSKGTHLEAK